MSRVRAFALLVALLAIAGFAGCGDDDSLAPEVPGEPASMPIQRAPEPPGGTAADEPADETETGTPEEDSTTPEPEPTEEGAAVPPAEDTGSTAVPPETAVTPPEDDAGGTTAPPAEADGPTNDTPPPAGSDVEQFEDFCAQNPGAC
jgi:hypothetical protein